MLTVETRTGLVAYEEQGTGTPLILLHANAGDHFHFDGIVPTLAQSYRTIVLDWPGFGASAPPSPPQGGTAIGSGGLPSGAKRLRIGTETYLNECLQEQAIKAILLEARSEAPIAAEVQRRHATFAQLEQADFAMLGWPDAEMAARLFVALCAEAALIELETGYNEAIRQTLWHFAHLDM